MKGKKRKEVHLHDAVLKALQKQADREGVSLKKHMERVLIRESCDDIGRP